MGLFHRLGSLVSRFWLPVIVAWLALAGAARYFAPRWDAVIQDGDTAYLPADMPSVEGELLLNRAFPKNKGRSGLAIVVERPDGRLSPADLRWVGQVVDQLRMEPDLPIVDIWDPLTPVVGNNLVSKVSQRGQAAVVLLKTSNDFNAVDNIRVLRRVRAVLDELSAAGMPAGLKLGVSGSAAVGGDLLAASAESIQNTELTTVILVVAILLVVYRAPLLALIPLATIGLSLFLSTNLLALLTQLRDVPGFEWWNFRIFSTTKIFIVVILFGAGTDFCLFLISRFKEELERGSTQPAGLTEAVGQVGEALVGSALTTILGLGMMYFADFGKFRNSGPAIALCLTITLLACLTLAPALLRASGHWVFWPLGIQPAGPDGASGWRRPTSRFWDWASSAIVARPGLILFCSLLLMAPLAYVGRDTPITFDFLNELSPERPSVAGTEMAQRHFPPGELAPITLLALRDGARFEKVGEGLQAIGQMSRELAALAGVERVRSLENPLGSRTRGVDLRRRVMSRTKEAKELYVSQAPGLAGDVTRFDLVLAHDPFARQSLDLLDRLERFLARESRDEQSFWYGARFEMVGTPVGLRDLRTVTSSDQVLIQQLVVVVVTGVLIVVLRRPLTCIYLILTVLLSYYVTIGATELLFAWLQGPRWDGLDWKVPLFLFVILIAVGEDYNIYLVTRVIEEQRKHGPLAGLRLATARTGGIITSCGVIMAGTFSSMLTGKLQGILQLGFSLSLGVMLDTCVVRPVLVPAFIALVERLRAKLSADAGAAEPMGEAVAANRLPGS